MTRPMPTFLTLTDSPRMVGVGWLKMAAQAAGPGVGHCGITAAARDDVQAHPDCFPCSERFWHLWDEMDALLRHRGRLLTYQTLMEKGACQSQLQLFRELFGESVEVTEERCESVYDRFSWDWAAARLFPYDVLDEYKRACQPSWKAFVAASIEGHKAAWGKYLRASARAFARAYNSDEVST